jgi:hypothetical protein
MLAIFRLGNSLKQLSNQSKRHQLFCVTLILDQIQDSLAGILGYLLNALEQVITNRFFFGDAGFFGGLFYCPYLFVSQRGVLLQASGNYFKAVEDQRVNRIVFREIMGGYLVKAITKEDA